MTQAHTPGPYEAVRNNTTPDWRVEYEQGGERYTLVTGLSESDAKLIAAAPELYEALKIAVEMEYDRDEESRNFENERLEYWQSILDKVQS